MLKLFYKLNRRKYKGNGLVPVFSSLFSMILCMVFLGGTTFAWFTSDVEVPTVPMESSYLSIADLEVYKLATESNAAWSKATGSNSEEISITEQDAEENKETVGISSPGNAEKQNEDAAADVATDSDAAEAVKQSAKKVRIADVEEIEREWLPVELNMQKEEILLEESKESQITSSEEKWSGSEYEETADSFYETTYHLDAEAGVTYWAKAAIEGNAAHGFLKIVSRQGEKEQEGFYVTVTPAAENYEFQFTFAESGEVVISCSWGSAPGDFKDLLGEEMQSENGGAVNGIAVVLEEGMNPDDVWILDEEILDEVENLSSDEDSVISKAAYYKGEILTCSCLFHCIDGFEDQRCQLCSVDSHGCLSELDLREECICESACEEKNMDEILDEGCNACIQYIDFCMGSFSAEEQVSSEETVTAEDQESEKSQEEIKEKADQDNHTETFSAQEEVQEEYEPDSEESYGLDLADSDIGDGGVSEADSVSGDGSTSEADSVSEDGSASEETDVSEADSASDRNI